jgi:hypothetical protein
MNRVLGGTVLVLLLITGLAHGQTLRPRIALVSPSGGQRGTTVAVTLTGVNLGYGTGLMFDGPGLTVEALTPEPPPANAKNPDGKIVVRVKIAPDAPLGRHALRVLTPLGPSEVGYFVVGEWPEVAEKEPNNAREHAQPLLALPVTVVGRSDGAEDVDVYRVLIRKGETIVFAAAAGSVGSALEPVLTLRDATRQERAFAAALRRPDALLTFTAPQTGDYFLSLRDLRYRGGPAHHYRLTVGRIPAVTSVFPLGGAAGTTLRLALSGVNLPTPPERAVPLPTEPPLAPLPLPELIGDHRLDIGTLPETTETEPNDLPDTAPRVTPPVTINGRIASSASALKPDADCFRFPATKGQVFTLEIVAARLGSPLDAVLSVLDPKGKELAANDDARGQDAALAFTAPEAGDYIAQIRDLSGGSGEAFGYRLHLAPATPNFSLAFSPDCLAVAPGDRVPFTVTATRQNGFDGDIALAFDGLPPGVRLLGTPIIAREQNTVTLLATADTSAAPSAAAPLRVTGTATIAEKPVVRRAESRERRYVKNNDKIEETTRPVPLPLVAVTGPPDLTVTIGVEHLTLTVGKTAELKVSVQRKAGFTAKIPLIIQGLPAGVSAAGTAEIPENKSEATLTLKAEANAGPGEASLTLLARSVVDELQFSDHAALPVTLTIAKEDPAPPATAPSAAKP